MPELRKIPPTIELTAEEVHPALREVMSQAEAKGSAEEALAIVISLWRDLQLLEDDTKTSRRKKNNATDAILLAGQKMALTASITRHLARHEHLTKRR